MRCAGWDRIPGLDVGCGAGLTACEIAKSYGLYVMGIDISEIMIVKAKKKAKRQNVEDKVEFRVADAYQLPFDDASFDVAIESVLTPARAERRRRSSRRFG